MRYISVITNGTDVSEQTKEVLIEKFEKHGFTVLEQCSVDSELLVCIGGDGALLQAVHKYDFPSIPIVGVNTGHLGFFQEIAPDEPGMPDTFIQEYKEGRYRLQPLNTVQAVVTTQNGKQEILRGLNEIVIRGSHSYSVHLDISIGDSPIEKFSGDGILVATSAGSTAYNYSLGGSIVDPRIKLLQVTPIAPMNTTAYRSFTSSILLPSELSLGIVPETGKGNYIFLLNDGIEHAYAHVQEIKIEFSETVINLIRFESYDFWDKVKTKFL
ncbi:NAD(+)/NADH kinase [bacterium 210820-DFI.6.37]|nr:NAD(+)/NADH kinase [bacterium 210820-DFI.6.37]